MSTDTRFGRIPWNAVIIIEKVIAIIVNGLCKHNAPNSNARFNYAFLLVGWMG